jgi:hypothetical protein
LTFESQSYVAVIEVLQDVLKSLNLSIANGIPEGLEDGAEVVGVVTIIGGVDEVDAEATVANETELPVAKPLGPGPVVEGGKLDDDDIPEVAIGVFEHDAASDIVVMGMMAEVAVAGMGFGGFCGVCFPPLRVPPISSPKLSFGP